MESFGTLTIRHNHGVDVLRDARVVKTYDYRYHGEQRVRFVGWIVEGVVVSGYSTSRLFSATSTRHDAPGTVKRWDLYGKRPTETSPGAFVVSMESCG